MAIRKMQLTDLSSIVRIHLESFTGFFLTCLGSKFLELLYEGVLDDPQGIILVSESDSEIEGFVAGVTDQRNFYKRLLKKRAFLFALASVGAVIKRPKIFPRLFRALSQPQRSSHFSANASLISIAVLPRIAGKGIGKELVLAFNSAIAARGITKYCLTTDRDNNYRVNRFYQKMGFQLADTFVTSEGRAMNEYLMAIK